MKYFGVFLIMGFVGISVFGAFGMHTGMQNHNGGCIAATAQGADCPKQGNPLEYLTFHLDAFRDFSTVIFEENLLAYLLVLALLAAGVGLALLLGNLAPPQSDLAYFRYGQGENFNSPPKLRLLRWLALHENSPATL